MASQHRAWQWAVAIGALVALAHVVLRITELFPIGAFADDGIYVALGKALASGEGYRSAYAVGSPPHLKYPPGLPALFAAIWSFAPDVEGFRQVWAIVTPLVTGTTAGLIVWIGHKVLELPVWLAACLGVGPLLTDPALHYLNLPLSEGLYLLLTSGLILALASSRGGRLTLAAAIVLAAAAPFLRAQGIVLIATLGIVTLARRSLGAAVVATVAATAPYAAWTLLRPIAAEAITQPDELPYTAWVGSGGAGEAIGLLGAGILTNARAYFWILAEHSAPLAAMGILIASALVALAVVGFVANLKERPEVSVPVGLTTLLILVWPWPQDRFLLPILPFAGLLIATVVSRWRPRPTALAMCLLVGLVGVRQWEVRQFAYVDYDPAAHQRVAYPSLFLMTNSRFLISTSRWLNHNASPLDRVVTPLHGGVYLYTGLRTTPASPAQPSVGTSVFDEPGAYLASRVLAEGTTLVALGDARSPMAHDVKALQDQCPGTVSTVGTMQDPSAVVFYGLEAEGSCVEGLAARLDGVWR